MQTIRRLYLYAVALVSLEVVIWGAIGLARSILAGEQIGGDVAGLAGALSLILVGAPVFLLHWWAAQRSAAADIEERSARIRAVFLYAALLATLIPVAQNLLALTARTLASLFDIQSYMVMLGGDQSLADNLTAMLLNALVGAYFFTIPSADRKIGLQGDDPDEVRRLYRYIWLFYSLAMTAGGAQQAIHYLFAVWQTVGGGAAAMLTNGLALLLVGAPLWVFVSWRVQRSLVEPAESGSMLRMAALYLLAMAGAWTVLVAGGMMLYTILRAVFSNKIVLSMLLAELGGEAAAAIVFGALWAYYGRTLSAAMRPAAGERAAGLRRLYLYVLSLGGLGATLAGMFLLVLFLLDALLAQEMFGVVWSERLAGALALLAVGLPLWLAAWRPMAAQAEVHGEDGDHARRSLVRKSYLYFVIFAGVMGVMFSAGMTFFMLLSALLGDPPARLLLEALRLIALLLLFILLLVYHWGSLRGDTRLAEKALAQRHAAFPVLVLAPENGDFAAQVVDALQREARGMPVAVHSYKQGAPDELLSAARAVILPAELAARPSEALRIWLQGFDGERIVLSTPVKDWHIPFASGRPLVRLARQAARAARCLAEGQDIPEPRDASPWMVLVYLFAAFVALNAIATLVNFLLDSF
jgi:hypothetical protein